MRHFSSALRCTFLLVSFICASTALAQGLSAPTLQATADGNTVALQWTDAEGYSTNRIERKSGGSDWILVMETGRANSYWDRSTFAGVTYTYRVQAITLDGRFTYSNEASATTEGHTLQPPKAPDLVADVSFNNIRLRWLPIPGATGYTIESRHDFVPWHEVVTLDADSVEYLITPLIEGMTYYFRIRAFNDAGGSPSPILPVAAPYDPSILPPAPTIYASAHTDTTITLYWDYIPRAWGYIVESRTNPSDPWVQIAWVGSGNATTTRHENLQPSTEYSYRIRALNGAGESPYSAVTTASTYPPPPPSPDLRGLPVSYKEIELRWTDVLTNSTTGYGYLGYRLESWTNNIWTQLRFPGVDDTNHFVGDLQPSTEYTFRIVALNPLASEWSTNTVRTMDPPPIPPSTAPIFFADRHSSTSLQLKWFDVYLETEYRIERENFPGGGIWQQIATSPANSTSYLDTNLQPATLYVYRIRAANSYGTSSYSHEAAASTRPPPEVPLLRGGADTPTEVFLLVQPAEGAVLYRLERMNASGEWQVIHETDTATFRFEDTGLEPSTPPYTYRAGARNAAGTWFYSANVTTQTWPLEFSATARPLSATSIELSWPQMPYAEHIYIQPLTNGISWPFRPIELDGTATNHIITDLKPSTTYSYRVYAQSAIGGRSPEAPVTVTTLGSISGDIFIRSITPGNFGAIYRLRLIGSTGQKFKVQSTADFNSWTDRTDPLTLGADMEVGISAVSPRATFYRTIRVD